MVLQLGRESVIGSKVIDEFHIEFFFFVLSHQCNDIRDVVLKCIIEASLPFSYK